MSKHMRWPQIHEAKGSDTDLAKLVGVTGQPHYLLLDGDSGEILAKGFDLRGDFLVLNVQEALKKRAQRKEK